MRRVLLAAAVSILLHALLIGAVAAALALLTPGEYAVAELDLSSVELSFAEEEQETAPAENSVASAPSAPEFSPPAPADAPPPPPENPLEETPPDPDAMPLPEPPPPAPEKHESPPETQEREMEREQESEMEREKSLPEKVETPSPKEPPPEKRETPPSVASESSAAPAPQQARIDAPPSPRKAIKPKYPRKSREEKEEGDVIIKLEVDATGRVTSAAVDISSGFPELDKAAVKAVEAARFNPAKSGSRPVSSSARITISFRLK